MPTTDTRHAPAAPTFESYVAARGPALWRAAWLLTSDGALAEDLVQTALARTWRHHDRVVSRSGAHGGSFDAYVRRTMVTTYLSWRGRRWHGEVPTAPDATPEPAGRAPDTETDAETSIDVARALGELTPRQRAVVVLRYFEDLTEVETARVLGCSPASVKTHHRRALATLRAGGLIDHPDGPHRPKETP